MRLYEIFVEGKKFVSMGRGKRKALANVSVNKRVVVDGDAADALIKLTHEEKIVHLTTVRVLPDGVVDLVGA